jgi:hypothetical protein
MPIKLKGVCNVCKREFDLDLGSFRVEIVHSELDKIVTIRVKSIEIEPKCGSEAAEHINPDDFVVCGKHCLLRHIDKSLGGEAAVLNGHEFGQEQLT